MKPALVFLDGTTTNAPDAPPKPNTEQTFPVAIVDKQLVVVGNQVTPEEQNAVEICLLYAWAAARAAIKDAGANPKAFLDAVINQLADLGFAVKSSQETTTSKILNLTEALTEVANRYLHGDQLKAFNAINHAWQRGTAPDQTLAILRNWWMSSSASGSATVVIWCMIAQENGQPSLTFLYLAFGQSVAPGYSSVEGFNLTSFATTLTLDMSVYKAEETDLRARLGNAINRHIQHTTLQLTVPD